MIYTESAQNLGVSLDRSTNKESALEATQQQLPFDHSLDQRPRYIEPAQAQAAAPAIESPDSLSRATHETLINTVSAQILSESLNRSTNQETAREATMDDDREMRKDRDKLSLDSLASQQQRPSDHRLEQTPTHPDPAPTKSAELEIEAPELDLGALIL